MIIGLAKKISEIVACHKKKKGMGQITAFLRYVIHLYCPGREAKFSRIKSMVSRPNNLSGIVAMPKNLLNPLYLPGIYQLKSLHLRGGILNFEGFSALERMEKRAVSVWKPPSPVMVLSCGRTWWE
jgi:hypothetical protein